MTKTKVHKNIYSVSHKKTEVLSKINIRDKWEVLLCIIALFSSFNGYPTSFLSILFLQMCQSKINMYICSMASIIYFATTFIKTAYNIPYIAFIFTYVIADYIYETYKGMIKPSYVATFTFLISKAYLLSFGFEGIFWLMFAVEITAFLFLPKCMKNGFKILKKNDYCVEPAEIFDVTSVLLVTAFALEGIKINGIIPSVCFLLAIAIIYEEKSNMSISLAAAICLFTSLMQSNNFAYLFSGFFIIYIGAIAFTFKNTKKYLVLCFLSLCVSLAFIIKFNSFVFLTTTAISLTICFIFDKTKIIDDKQKVYDNHDTVGEGDYLCLMNKLDKLNRCYRFIGHTVIDISNLLTKEEIPQEMENIVCNEICKNCKNNTYCWQENYSYTQNQFSSYATALRKNSFPIFDERFLSICNRVDKIEKSFSNAYRLMSTQKLVHSAAMHNQKILQNQFLILAQSLKEITYESSKSGIANMTITHEINNYLKNIGKNINYCICYQNNNKCVINTDNYFDESEIYKIKTKLELLYGAKFDEPIREQDEESVIYSFYQIPMFTTEINVENSSLHAVCGDSYKIINTGEYTYIILADGMGTGSFAAAESKTAITMMESLLAAQVEINTAIEIVNIALNLKGTGQSCVSLDVLRVNLNDGNANIYKAGGATSIILSSNKVTPIYEDSLPVGILKDIKIAEHNFVLNNGDMVAILSDGVNIQKDIIEKLNTIGTNHSAEEISKYILNTCKDNDDATVAVFKLIRA